MKKTIKEKKLKNIMLCGNLCHSRWVTTGEAILFLWVSKHGLEGELEERLKVIVTFTLQVYHQMFFQIKVLHSIDNGPRHVLTQLKLIRQQPQEVQDIVMPYALSGAWFAHSEAILLTLVSSPDIDERKFGVSKILEMRGEQDLGDSSVRPRKTPALNIDADSLLNLISWSKDIHEPIFTTSLTKHEVMGLVEEPLPVPLYSVHTQSVERVVKLVTEAASSVVGYEARDGFIRARMEHLSSLPKFNTKHML